MRYLGILLVIVSFPIFLSLLRSKQGREWAFFAIGALPILHGVINVDAAFINWATWPGHTKGLVLTILDPLALAICIRFGSRQGSRFLILLGSIYISSLVPGLFTGPLFQPSLFYFVQAIRIFVLAYAVYLVVGSGHLRNIATGLAVALIVNAFYVIRSALAGASQAPGVLGHQNLTGVAVNLCVPLLLVLGLRRGGSLYLVAVVAGGISAVAGGSRATIVFYGAAVIATLVGSLSLQSTARKGAVAMTSAVAIALATPFAVQKVSERGGVLSVDLERLAFERAAHMMIADHPWGVGLNQYVTVANTQGYLDRAGVRWGMGARATNVHNTYLLTRVEGGTIAFLGWLAFLLIPLGAAIKVVFDKKAQMREVCVGVASAFAITAVHSGYEWIMVTIVPQYLMAILIGITAAALAQRRRPVVPERQLEPVIGTAKSDDNQNGPSNGPVHPGDIKRRALLRRASE